MKRYCLVFAFCSLFLMPIYGSGQSQTSDSLPDDPRYREDQFYAGIAVNFMSDLPANVDQSGFSGSARFGFLRDMPINKRRNLALAIGGGLSFNTYNQNMKIDDSGQDTSFSPLEDEDFDSNRFSTYIAEIPFELRWRTSTRQRNNFWRVYLGFKLGYMFYFKSRFEGRDGNIEVKDPEGLERWRYSLTLSGGYSKVNFYMDYSLNGLFSDVDLDGTSTAVGIQPIKAGLIFYIL